ncbi:MAG: glycoside hydrolase family 3 C-terminal domain-containing protein [Treponema sp.]|nr:glycoside hydrolase family 3 C-terminal domain-containing protein [Spirochaetales bacterium]MDY5811239.1 glycoside hydrolase family 3 C-terminal domain-containing protein [Treponema sp.]
MSRDIKQLISQMTLEEKASLCSGSSFWDTKAVDRLGIPSVMVSDGPHGLRKMNKDGTTITTVCFPAACATASSFDTELLEEVGDTLGQQCRAQNVSVLLGPAMNIKRSPLCGRNFEYISEDPYLSGKIAAAHIRGVQKWNVGTSVKHFACNNQEYFRMSVSSEIDERTFREIYLTGFEIAVKESKPKTIMASYNQINGVYSTENKRLLTDILRKEWGFDGYVMTDWGAVADRAKGIAAGLDLEMPASGGVNDAKIVEAVKAGTLDEKLLDKAVENMLNVLFDYVDNPHDNAVFDNERDHKKAVQVESECAVLLENNGILPLKKDAKILYVEEFAKVPRFQGGGSSHIISSRVSSAFDAAKEKKRNVEYCKGFPADRDFTDQKEIDAAVEKAKSADVVVVFAGLPDVIESEGFDRKNMNLPECQNKLISEILKVNKNVAVVLHNGAPVVMPWRKDVSAILEMYLGGQGVGEATDMLLYGEANPCGHLAETFPLRVEDTPCYLSFGGDGITTKYNEGIFVGYRYYEKKNIPVAYAFGHGLSYTTFEISNLCLSSASMKEGQTITATVDVKNTGKVAGKEVVQFYVADKTKTFGRPVKELKGFKKVYLEPGETKKVSVELDARSLSYYEVKINDWYAKSGEYEILAGNASDNIRASAKLNYITEHYLPLEIKGDTTFNELFNDERTAPVFRKFLAKYNYSSESMLVGDMGPAGKEMLDSMFISFPLKSLFSFGMGTRKEVEDLIEDLKKAVE